MLTRAELHLADPKKAVQQAADLLSQHIQRKGRYFDLVVFLCYFALYLLILGLAVDPTNMHEMQKPVMMCGGGGTAKTTVSDARGSSLWIDVMV